MPSPPGSIRRPRKLENGLPGSVRRASCRFCGNPTMNTGRSVGGPNRASLEVRRRKRIDDDRHESLVKDWIGKGMVRVPDDQRGITNWRWPDAVRQPRNLPGHPGHTPFRTGATPEPYPGRRQFRGRRQSLGCREFFGGQAGAQQFQRDRPVLRHGAARCRCRANQHARLRSRRSADSKFPDCDGPRRRLVGRTSNARWYPAKARFGCPCSRRTVARLLKPLQRNSPQRQAHVDNSRRLRPTVSDL